MTGSTHRLLPSAAFFALLVACGPNELLGDGNVVPDPEGANADASVPGAAVLQALDEDIAMRQRQTPKEEAPPVIEMEGMGHSRVEGMAVDSETGAALPHLRFRIHSPRPKFKGRRASGASNNFELLTDEHGRFSVDVPAPGALFTISAMPGQLQPAQRGVDIPVPTEQGEERLLVVKFIGGPMYYLATDPPMDLTGWSLNVIPEGAARPLAQASVDVDANGAHCRPPTKRLKSGSPVVLALGSPDGHHLGCLEIPWEPTRGQEPLVFSLESTGTLKIHARRDPLPEDETELSSFSRDSYTQTDLAPIDGQEILARAWRLRTMCYLSPGLYRARAWNRECVPVEERVSISSREDHTLELRLRSPARARWIQGRAVSEDGAALPDMDIQVALRGDCPRRWTISYSATPLFCGTGIDHYLRVEAKTTHEGKFRIERVPAGELAITASSYDLPTEVSWTEDTDGNIEVKVLVLDTAGPGIGFHSPHGTGLISNELSYPARFVARATDGGDPIAGPARDGAIVARVDPTQRRFEWALWRLGQRTVFGDQSDFAPEGGGRFFATVSSEPGWSRRVIVQDASGNRLPHAPIYVDDLLVGTSGPRGELLIELEERPTSVTATMDDRRPVKGTFPENSYSTAWHTITLVSPD